MRTHNLAEIDVNDLSATREAVEQANRIGHWRRMLALFGDHLAKCQVRSGVRGCDCGFRDSFANPGSPTIAALDEPFDNGPYTFSVRLEKPCE